MAHKTLLRLLAVAAAVLSAAHGQEGVFENTENAEVKAAPKTDARGCPDYTEYASERGHGPVSSGRYQLPFQRPEHKCRTFVVPEVETTIDAMRKLVQDPDLFRLFENCFPNTLDTAIAWHGLAAARPDEDNKKDGRDELTFVTTGDINAMWLRDSANQLQSYRSLLTTSKGEPRSTARLASLFRGTINLQARYIRDSPHCNAFRPPAESGLTVTGGFGLGDSVTPPVDHDTVYECKYELDSLAAFLQLSHDYYQGTGDLAFFGGPPFTQFANTQGGSSDDVEFRSGWVRAVESLVRTATDMLAGTYSDDGRTPLAAPYTFQRPTNVGSETLSNSGAGSPVMGRTGMVRSAFRPSDDACTYQLFVPANMMLSRYLEACAEIMQHLGDLSVSPAAGSPKTAKGDKWEWRRRGRPSSGDADFTYWNGHRKRYHTELAIEMQQLAGAIRAGIEEHGRTRHAVFGDVYAYEVDGFGSHNMMDDANIPSLLSAPLLGYVDRADPVYQNTRRFVLSRYNPYYMQGPVINGTGGPHVGVGMAWPMAVIVQIMTEDDDDEIARLLTSLVSSTDGLGLMHESVRSDSEGEWTRPWFSWANGLFGQMLLDLRDRKPHLLKRSYQ
ncbi:hypothetical protein F503_06705 [Ophiostoma piceae UAMH 11346]|uniref:Duf1237 domain-containing protein n=1 Tax=Ophiostoma piceae (strain UAMH 11346) TaxID=1262450 RepID=S3BSU6_OPHP1|nr:hypothetical protein F503_06705 [Ophiostoma piceae UAMH 11346]